MDIDEGTENAMLDAAAARVNGGDCLFREGSTTLLTFSLKATAFAAAAGGEAQLDVADPAMSAAASADATVALDNYQFRSSLAEVRLSGDIGAIGSGAEIEMNHPDVKQNDVVDMLDFMLYFAEEAP